MSTQTVRVVFLGDSAGAVRHVTALDKSVAGLSTRALALRTALAGLALGGFGFAVREAVAFDRQMRNVNSLIKLSETRFQALSKSVLAMAKETGQAPKVLAAGLYDIVSSGFKAGDALKVLRASARAGTAGMTDTATAAKAVTAALNAYHRPADDARKVSDVLFQTVNLGVLRFEELSQQMGDLVPVAAPLGVTLEEVGAAMSTLTLQGVPAAEAATRVKNTMIQLASPSKQLTAIFKANGFASGEAAVKAVGFAGVLQMIDKSTRGNVTATAALTPEIRSLMGIVGLTGRNLATYNEHLAKHRSASEGAGATAKAFAEQSKSLGVQWDKVKVAMIAAAIPIATLLFPSLEDAGKSGQRFARYLTEHQDEIRDGFRDIGHVIGDVADVLATIADLVGGWDELFKLLLAGTLATKVYGLAAAFTTLAGAETAAGGAGIAGAAASSAKLLRTLRLLSGIGILTVAIELIIFNKPVGEFLDNLEHEARQRLWKALGLSNFVERLGDPETSAGSSIAVGGKGTLATPQSFTPTHQTSRLAGFPAVDIFASAGTKLLAPENGTLTRTSGGDPSMTPAATKGYSLYFVGNESGNTYFITHLAAVAPTGYYRKGDVIGTIAAGTQGGPHAHVGIHKGVSPKAYMPSTSAPPSPFAKSGGGGGGTTGGGTTPVNPFKAVDLAVDEDAPALAAKGAVRALRAQLSFIGSRMDEAPGAVGAHLKARVAEIRKLLSGIVTEEEAERAKRQTENLMGQLSRALSVKELLRRAPDLAGPIKKALMDGIVTEKELSQIRGRFDRLNDIIAEKARKIREDVEDAMSASVSKGGSLFDKATQALIDAERARGDAETPKEKELRELREKRSDDQLQSRISAAREKLAKLKAGIGGSGSSASVDTGTRDAIAKLFLALGIQNAQAPILGLSLSDVPALAAIGQPGTTVTAEDIADATRELDDLLADEYEAKLEREARAERAAVDASTKLAVERIEDERSAMRELFQARLAEVVTGWGREEITTREAVKRINAILAEYLGPGAALAATTPGGQVQEPPVSGHTSPRKPIQMPEGFAEGGIAWSPTRAWVGEEEPELIVPLSKIRRPSGSSGLPAGGLAMGGGQPLNVTIVLEGDDAGIARFIRVKAVEASPEISLRIGQEADSRRRAGRY